MDINTTDEKIIDRFQTLITNTEQLLMLMEQSEGVRRAHDRANHISSSYEYHHCEKEFFEVHTNFLTLLRFFPPSPQINYLIDVVQPIDNVIPKTKKMLGIIKGLFSDYKNGMLRQFTEMIEANVEADHLEQAERLLSPDGDEHYSHVPAAVLLGAIFEDALRRICIRQEPEILTTKANGESKKVSLLIDELKQAGVYNELKAKQLRSWADIRNAAAHGKFNEFNEKDVQQMFGGIQSFLTDFL